jgi:hypothetical protein
MVLAQQLLYNFKIPPAATCSTVVGEKVVTQASVTIVYIGNIHYYSLSEMFFRRMDVS